jgi:hypothetical protein
MTWDRSEQSDRHAIGVTASESERPLATEPVQAIMHGARNARMLAETPDPIQTSAHIARPGSRLREQTNRLRKSSAFAATPARLQRRGCIAANGAPICPATSAASTRGAGGMRESGAMM